MRLLFCISFLLLVVSAAVSEDQTPLTEPGVEDSLILALGGDSASTSLIDPMTRAVRQAERTMTEKSEAIRIGEKLVYSVRYGIIRAGDASLEVQGIEEVDGFRCFHVISRAKSNSFFDRIFKVRDTVQSWMDVDFLYSHRFEKKLREGGFRRHQAVEMDQRNRMAKYDDGSVVEIAAGAHDILSALYYVRTVSLQPGEEILLDSHMDRKNYPLRVLIHGREEIDTPAGTFSCLVVEPVLRTPGLFNQEGNLTVWLTDDARRMPVQMKSKIAIGSISVVLTDYARPE